LLQQQSNIHEVATKARKWYNSTDSPRFLWIHLMDLHEPYLPGLQVGLKEGLLNVYQAFLEHEKNREALDDETLELHRRLYRECVKLLDRRIDRLFEFIDTESTVFILGDHGQEFDHGVHMHARMYEEVIKVPLLMRWTLDKREFGSPIRQIDIPPLIVDGIQNKIPDSWEGKSPVKNEERPSFSIGHAPYLNKTFTAVRTSKYKYHRTFDGDSLDIINEELYNIKKDPGEERNIYGRVSSEDITKKLDKFINKDGIEIDFHQETAKDHDQEDVHQRLKHLGYVE